MIYVNGAVIPVPTANKDAYIAKSLEMAAIFKDHGALQVVDCWGDMVPDGKLTSFPMAVKCAPDETVVFSWITWPSKEVANAGMQKAMADPRMSSGAMPFDASRMIFAQFEMIVNV